jgi:hypothetical protein
LLLDLVKIFVNFVISLDDVSKDLVHELPSYYSSPHSVVYCRGPPLLSSSGTTRLSAANPHP